MVFSRLSNSAAQYECPVFILLYFMNNKTSLALEYYHPVFFHYIPELRDEIHSALIRRPNHVRLKFWKQFTSLQAFFGDDAWSAVKSYLSALEDLMEQILKTHSVFFWLHMYRRIGVFLAEDHPGKRDANTLALVRSIVESAIAKYGSLDKTSDVRLSHTVKQEEILGGHLLKVLSAHDNYRSLLDAILTGKQWVLTEWEPTDLVNMFGAEGLAYEYWRATALLRSIGKGAGFKISHSEGLIELRDNALAELIESYDNRIFKYSSLSSSKGITFLSSNRKEQQFKILAAAYNVTQAQIPLLSFNDGGTSNFMLFDIDLV